MIILPEREATSIHQSPSFNQQGHATVQAPKKLLLTAAVDSKSTLLHAQQEARGRGDDGENRGSTKRYLAIFMPGITLHGLTHGLGLVQKMDVLHPYLGSYQTSHPARVCGAT